MFLFHVPEVLFFLSCAESIFVKVLALNMLYPRRSMHHTVLPLSLLLLSLVSRISAGTWVYPLPNTNPIYNRTDTLNATWATTFTDPYMVLWCQATGASTFTAGQLSLIAIGGSCINETRRLQCFSPKLRVARNRSQQIRQSGFGMLSRGD